jgi:hypothetical protein
MKLYTINATPVRAEASKAKNDEMCAKYPAEVASILKAYGFDGFTIQEVAGYWQGKPERSFKIELAAEPSSVINDKINIIETIAQELRDVYKQDSVMLTSDTVTFI